MDLRPPLTHEFVRHDRHQLLRLVPLLTAGPGLYLSHNAPLFQGTQQPQRCGAADSEPSFDESRRDEWVLTDQVDQRYAVRGAHVGGRSTVALLKLDETFRAHDRVERLVVNGGQEQLDPGDRIT